MGVHRRGVGHVTAARALRRGARTAVVVVALLALTDAPGAGAQEADDVIYSPPVDAPVVDPFRPPPQPWLPGNRGIEYATASGTPVGAAGRGVVSFAGPVAGSLHVTVTHPDGIRTSYSYLVTIDVTTGQTVAPGDVIGSSGSRLHVGARRGEVYIDPASLWGQRGPPWVRLVPDDGGQVGAGVPAPDVLRARPDRPGVRFPVLSLW